MVDMKFVIIVLVIFVLIVVDFNVAFKPPKFRCIPNVPYIENNCNNCVCSSQGELGCTQKFCGGDENQKLRNCTVGTVQLKKRNWCTCVKDMGTICTNYDC